MYILFGIFFFICIVFYFIHFFRRKHIINKLCSMDACQKQYLFNTITASFGFCYSPDADVVTSTLDAWQKDFGYCSLYDKSSPKFNMIFDCEPIYFHYENRTWLIEFWKGQYGINIGGEVGIYRADSIITPDQFHRTIFHGVPKEDLLSISFSMHYKGQPLFSISKDHWWLTGFRMGSYCEPEDLTMDISLTFPNQDLLQCFVQSMLHTGYNTCELSICDLTVSFTFSTPHSRQPRWHQRWHVSFSQWKNRLFCRLYTWITRPFHCTVDQLLYLYYFLPISFRHMLLFKRNRKQKRKKDRPHAL